MNASHLFDLEMVYKECCAAVGAAQAASDDEWSDLADRAIALRQRIELLENAHNN